MQAMVWAMDDFEAYWRGRQLTVFADHKPLENLSKRQDKTMKRLTVALLKYNFVIKYRKEVKFPLIILAEMSSI
jgi:hypothetical protein